MYRLFTPIESFGFLRYGAYKLNARLLIRPEQATP